MHVTVVMPVFNRKDSVGAAVGSIVNQTYQDWELVMVDDGSTDGTPDLVCSLFGNESRVRVIRDSSNLGVGTRANQGWRCGTGDLVARMDSDDVSFPERIARQVEFLAAHPGVSVLGTAAELVDERDRRLGVAVRPEHHETLVAKIYKECPFINPTVMMRRSFLEETGGYRDGARNVEDLDLWLRGYRRHRYHNLQEPYLLYRVRTKQQLAHTFRAAKLLLASAYRERLFTSHGWYAGRYLVANLLTRANMYHTRLR